MNGGTKMSSEKTLARFNELSEKINSSAPARERLVKLFDENSFVEIDAFVGKGEDEAGVVAGYGLVEGGVVYAFSQDVTVNKGAVSVSHASKIIKIFELAAKTGCPVVAVYDSNGAKLDEGQAMLSKYSQMLMLQNNLSGVVPQISLVMGTCGGVSAMLAAGADFVVMENKAELFMTAPFVAKANGDNDKLAGTAEAAARAGVASIVCDGEDECIAKVKQLLTLLPQNNLATLPLFDFEENQAVIDTEGCPKDIVKTVADLDSCVELDKDFANGAYTFLGTIAGITTAFVTTSKNNPLNADACSKVARFVKICDAFNIPLVTFLNSKGFELNSDLRAVKEASRMASAYAEATTAKISVITGKAFGPAYVALGAKSSNADVVIAWPQAEISALPVETAVEFLWADKFKGTEDANATRKELTEEYALTEASPIEAARAGYVENVVMPENTRSTVIAMLDMLAGKRETKLPKKHTTI